MARTDGLDGPIRPTDGTSGRGRGSGKGNPHGSGGHGSGGHGLSSGEGPRRGRRRPAGRLRLIFAGVLLLLLLEIVVLIAIGEAIGPWWTLGLLMLFVVVGGVLVRREGSRTWRALRTTVETGRMPGRELADAILVLVGGLLLLLPGFISDLVGLFVILPFTRGVSRRLLQSTIGARVMPVPPSTGRTPSGQRPGADEVIEGEIISEEPPPEP